MVLGLLQMADEIKSIDDLCTKLGENEQAAKHIRTFTREFLFEDDSKIKKEALKRLKKARLKDYQIMKLFSGDNYILAHLNLSQEHSNQEIVSICSIPPEYQGRNYDEHVNENPNPQSQNQ